MGDVAGRGVSAALFTAMSQTFLKRIAEQGEAPGTCLTAMNRLLFPEGFPDLFVTVFYGLLNTQTGDLAYANAGHPSPYVLREGGIVASLDGAAEAPVWQTLDYDYPTRQVALQPGEGLIPVYPGDYRGRGWARPRVLRRPAGGVAAAGAGHRARPAHPPCGAGRHAAYRQRPAYRRPDGAGPALPGLVGRPREGR